MKVAVALASLSLPGLAHTPAAPRAIAIGWALAGLVTTALVPLSVWGVALAAAVRLACAIDAARRPAACVGAGASRAAIAIGAVGLVALSLGSSARGAASSSMWPTIAIGDRVIVDEVLPRQRAVAPGALIVFESPCARGIEHLGRVVAAAGARVEIRCGALFVDGAAVPRTLLAARRDQPDRHEDGTQLTIPRAVFRETLAGHAYEIALGTEDAAQRGPETDFPRDRAPTCPGSAAATGAIVTTAAAATGCAPHRHFVVPPAHVFVLGDNRDNANDSRFWGALPIDHITGRATWRFAPLGRLGDLD